MEENKDMGKCEHGMFHCCHNWKKCPMMKKVLCVIIVIIAFCIGTEWGEMKSEFKSHHFEKGEMNWNYNKFENKKLGNPQKVVGEVTVEVKDTTPTATQ